MLELIGDEGAPVLHESALRRLQELNNATGEPVVWLAADDPLASKGETEQAVWMRIHRAHEQLRPAPPAPAIAPRRPLPLARCPAARAS